MEVSRKLQRRLKCVLREFLGGSKEVSRKFQGYFIKVSKMRKFQGCFEDVSCLSRVLP